MVDNTEAERDAGIENNAIQTQPLRSRENIYEYRDSPSAKFSKAPTDISSLRSPSSLAMTQTTKSGSQSSLKSAISMKETSMNPMGKESNFGKNIKYAEDAVDVETKSNKYNNVNGGRSNIGNAEKNRSRDLLTSSPIESSIRSGSSTPVPSSRSKNMNSRTHLIEGIPQTEV